MNPMHGVPETLLGLVSHYSPSGQEDAAVSFLIQRMKALGFSQAFRDAAGNAVGIIGDGPRQIVLLGHIDTVPGEISIRLEDGLLYGRGTVDAKGPLAAFVDAVAALDPQPGWQVVVIGAVGEESDSRGARHVVDQYRPEMVVIGEPSAWERITLGYKGSIVLRVAVRHEMQHSANGQQTACENAIQIWQKVQASAASYNAQHERSFDQVQPSLLNWSSATDGFVNQAFLQIGTRLPPGLSPDDWLIKMKELAGEEGVNQSGDAIPAWRCEKNTPLVRAFLAAIRAAGGKPGFVVKTGTADMNIVVPAWQCPALAYGPGDSSLDHTPGEHISLHEYEQAVNVLVRSLKHLI